MKRTIVVAVFSFTTLVLVCCHTEKKIEYSIPDSYQGQTRKNLESMLAEGQKLYKINCSKCHGIFTKGKENIPNFTQTQIENYRAAVLIDDPVNHSVAQRIRPEDLDRILQFLTFRKKKAPSP